MLECNRLRVMKARQSTTFQWMIWDEHAGTHLCNMYLESAFVEHLLYTCIGQLWHTCLTPWRRYCFGFASDCTHQICNTCFASQWLDYVTLKSSHRHATQHWRCNLPTSCESNLHAKNANPIQQCDSSTVCNSTQQKHAVHTQNYHSHDLTFQLSDLEQWLHPTSEHWRISAAMCELARQKRRPRPW